MGVHVTRHAIERAMQRIPGIRTEEQARALLSGAAVECAIAFACGNQCFVRLPTGQRITVRDNVVTTVIPDDNYRRNVRRVGRNRYE